MLPAISTKLFLIICEIITSVKSFRRPHKRESRVAGFEASGRGGGDGGEVLARAREKESPIDDKYADAGESP